MASQPFHLQATFPIFENHFVIEPDKWKIDRSIKDNVVTFDFLINSLNPQNPSPILFLCSEQEEYFDLNSSKIKITTAIMNEAINSMMLNPDANQNFHSFAPLFTRFPVIIVYFVHHPTSTIIRKVIRKSDLSKTQRQKRQFIPLQATHPIFEERDDTTAQSTFFSRAYHNAKIPGQDGQGKWVPNATASIINFLNTSTSFMKREIEDALIFFGLDSLRQYGIPYHQVHKPAVENYHLDYKDTRIVIGPDPPNYTHRLPWRLRTDEGRGIRFSVFVLNAYLSVNIVLESMGSLLKATEALGILRPNRIERGPYPSATWSYQKQILLEQSGDQPPLPSSSTASIVSNYQDYRREHPEQQSGDIPIATALANVVASLQGGGSSSSSSSSSTT